MAVSIELSAHELQALCQRYLSEQTAILAAEKADKQLGFEILSYKAVPTSDAPAGFLGRHQYLLVDVLLQKASDDGKEKVQKLRFFTKSAPHDISSRMEYIEEFGVFKKEILVYRHVLPELEKLVPKFAPQCYYAENNILVFENLMDQGYKMAAGRDGLLDYAHLKCSIKALAAMHASSLVCEARQGKRFTQLWPEAVSENAYPAGISAEHVRAQNVQNASRVCMEIAKNLPKYEKQLDLVLEQLPLQMARVFELAQTSTRYLNAFSHGDLWANNAMFRYNAERPIECRFVDYQLARYAPPMLDIITLLTIPTSREFRAKHLSTLLSDYYRFLAELLAHAGLCIDALLPRAQYNESAQEYRIFGLIESCLFSHLTVLPPAFTQNLTTSTDGFNDFFANQRVSICMKAFHSDQLYRERMTDMLEDFIDNFILKK